MAPKPLILDVMADAARQAGEYLLAVYTQQAPGAIRYKGGNITDIVTHHDERAQEIIHTLLLKNFPILGFMGEEGDAAVQVQHPAYFCVDPLDGTANFTIPSLHLPWAVSVAYIEHTVPAAGVTYVPTQKLICTSQRDAVSGRYQFNINQESEVPAVAARQPEAWVLHGAMGHALQQWVPEKEYLGCMAFLQRCETAGIRLRNSGSTAHDMAHVAIALMQGHKAATFSPIGFPWDFASGITLIRGVGGVIATHTGNRYERVDDYSRILTSGLQPRAEAAQYKQFTPVIAGHAELVETLCALQNASYT